MTVADFIGQYAFVLLGVLAIGLIANGGGDGVSVDPAQPPKETCFKEGC